MFVALFIKKSLLISFILLQILSAGNINYQQEAGYYEINPIYGKHPSKKRVYITKTLETVSVYGLTKIFPKYDNHILIGANFISLGFIINDKRKGIDFKLRF